MAAGDTSAVKKNLVVLLTIAFVIAVAATGLFYGMFADKFKDNSSEAPRQTVMVAARALERGAVLRREDVRPVELQGPAALRGAVTSPDQAAGRRLVTPLGQGAPVLESVLVNANEAVPSVDDVPPRMRAVTLHVAESGTVLALLHPGSRVDIQAIANRAGVTELRRVLQDVEVASTGPAESVAGHALLPQITVLVRPEQADIVALADTASRVRIVLRNRQDRSGTAAPRLDLTSLFQGPLPMPMTPAIERPGASAVAAAAPTETMQVRILAAAPTTMKQLGVGGSAEVWRVQAIADAAGDASAGEAELSASEVSFGASDTATVRAGTSDCSVRIRLRLRQELEISPELIWRDGDSTRTASLDARVDPGSARGYAIAGFNAALAGVLARAFPGRNLEGRELLVTIVPRHAENQQARKQQAIARR
ncbi:MAG: Flp pilus assembly protein CpaB [Bryobacteraceae bacterium]|jgi:Flp pilus assembly protein CpaB